MFFSTIHASTLATVLLLGQEGAAVFGVTAIIVGNGHCCVFTRRWARRLAARTDESARVNVAVTGAGVND